jgi:hypothetical protein
MKSVRNDAPLALPSASNTLVPTRKSEVPLLAAQRRR